MKTSIKLQSKEYTISGLNIFQNNNFMKVYQIQEINLIKKSLSTDSMLHFQLKKKCWKEEYSGSGHGGCGNIGMAE